MIAFKHFSLALAAIVLTAAIATAQPYLPDKKPEYLYKYSFNMGDSLFYESVSYDSISINYGDPLLKIRKERILVVCDSVDAKGFFHLSQTLVSHNETQACDTTKTDDVSSNWTGRTVSYAIDSLGRRAGAFYYDNPQKPGSAPGGAFAPYLLTNLGEPRHKLDETWLVEDSLALPENGLPFPAVRNTFYYKAKRPLDTLGESCVRAEFIRTGQGKIDLSASPDEEFWVACVFNGYSRLTLSDTKFVPVHIFATLEQKLTINVPNNGKKPGTHHITTNIKLARYVPGAD